MTAAMTASSPTASSEPLAGAGGVMAPASGRVLAWTLVLALALPLALTLGLRAGPGNRWDTALPPPSGRETHAEVMPARIAGVDARISTWTETGRYRGVRARYGERTTVAIIQAASSDDAAAWLASHVQPRLANWPRHARGGPATAHWLHGWGDGRLYAWQNGTWLFLIEADSDAAFDQIVARFAYIRPR